MRRRADRPQRTKHIEMSAPLKNTKLVHTVISNRLITKKYEDILIVSILNMVKNNFSVTSAEKDLFSMILLNNIVPMSVKVQTIKDLK